MYIRIQYFDVCSCTVFQKPNINTRCAQVLYYVQAACNKYDQHDIHTTVSIAQRLSIWRNSCQNYVTGVGITQQLSVLCNSRQYCITAELVMSQGTTCPRQTS